MCHGSALLGSRPSVTPGNHPDPRSPTPAKLMSPSASRRYLPVLRGFPAKYIYDPWNAPEPVQAAAKCIIGVHYPKPMVHHAEASRLNIERMKQIYQQLSRYRGLGESFRNEASAPRACRCWCDAAPWWCVDGIKWGRRRRLIRPEPAKMGSSDMFLRTRTL